jgi:hypothetical protein
MKKWFGKSDSNSKVDPKEEKKEEEDDFVMEEDDDLVESQS